MRYTSADLINEHEGILLGLKILEKIVYVINDKVEYDRSDIKKIIEFLKLFADKCHHGKEEGLLFPAMESAGIEKGLIDQMLKEHEKGREYIRKMSEANSKNKLNSDFFIEASMKYIELLREHINKENTILFPLGDKAIPQKIQNELLEQFEKHEEMVMGKGTHEKLHEMLHDFTEKYLKNR